MSGQELTSFLTMGETPRHGSRGWRRDGLPDAGASEDLDFEPSGVRITVRSRGFHRHGQISWRQVASWIDTGLTPARLGIIIAASRLHIYTYARRDQLIAAGKDNIDAAISELSQISTDAIDAALGAALSARDADAPVPPARPGKPAYRTTAMLTRPDPAATPEENTALARIARTRGRHPGSPAGHPGRHQGRHPLVDRRQPAGVRPRPRQPRGDARLDSPPGQRPGQPPRQGHLRQRHSDAITAHPPKDCGPAKAATPGPRPSSCGRKSPHGYSRACPPACGTGWPPPSPARPPAASAQQRPVRPPAPLTRPARRMTRYPGRCARPSTPPGPPSRPRRRPHPPSWTSAPHLYRDTGTAQEPLPASPAQTGQPARP